MLSELPWVLFAVWKCRSVSPVQFSAGPSSFTSGDREGSLPIPCSGILETELYDWLKVLFVIDLQYGWVKFPDCNRSGCFGSSKVAFKAIDNSIVWSHSGTGGPRDCNVSCVTRFVVHTCCQSACGLVWTLPWKSTLILCMLDDAKLNSGPELFVMSQRAHASALQVSGEHHLAVPSTDHMLIADHTSSFRINVTMGPRKCCWVIYLKVIHCCN